MGITNAKMALEWQHGADTLIMLLPQKVGQSLKLRRSGLMLKWMQISASPYTDRVFVPLPRAGEAGIVHQGNLYVVVVKAKGGADMHDAQDDSGGSLFIYHLLK